MLNMITLRKFRLDLLIKQLVLSNVSGEPQLDLDFKGKVHKCPVNTFVTAFLKMLFTYYYNKLHNSPLRYTASLVYR